MVQRWRETTHNGLPADQREALSKKYSPSETVSFLKAPALNQECKVANANEG